MPYVSAVAMCGGASIPLSTKSAPTIVLVLPKAGSKYGNATPSRSFGPAGWWSITMSGTTP